MPFSKDSAHALRVEPQSVQAFLSAQRHYLSPRPCHRRAQQHNSKLVPLADQHPWQVEYKHVAPEK